MRGREVAQQGAVGGRYYGEVGIVSLKCREESVRDRIRRIAGESRGRIEVFYCCLFIFGFC